MDVRLWTGINKWSVALIPVGVETRGAPAHPASHYHAASRKAGAAGSCWCVGVHGAGRAIPREREDMWFEQENIVGPRRTAS